MIGILQMELLILFSCLLMFANPGLAADNTNLVYKGCADQKFPDGAYTQSLNTLFDTLTSEASSAKFSNATAGSGGTAVNGLFQCRGDLSGGDCSSCVRKTPETAKKLCGGAVAVRVQLGGCYLRYEVAGFKLAGPTELLFKICGSTQASGSGFQDRLDNALSEVAKGVGNSNGFYTGGYQSVYVLGQCEGDLSNGDCVECVKAASQKAKSECGPAISAQVYLQQCYISYKYYPNGVPGPTRSTHSSSSGANTQKTIAIVLGGLVGVGLVLACLMFTRSTLKKQSHSSKHGGY